jgi:hypothetical protein
MPVKTFITNLEEVAEHYRDDYEQTDGGFTLKLDDADYQKKIGEFRGNNIQLSQQLEDAQKKLKNFEGVDPVKYKAQQDVLQKLEEKQLLEAGQVEKVLEQRTQTMKADYEGQVQALKTSIEDLQQKATTYKRNLDTLAVDNAIVKAVTAIAQLKPNALEDVKLRAKTIWKVKDDGNLVPMDGDRVLYGKDGSAPMSPAEWAMNLTTIAPYLFEPNTGGGSQGGGRSQQSGDKLVSRSAFSANLEDIASGKKKVLLGD